MFLTIAQTAEYLNISTTQVKRLSKKDDFPTPYSFGVKSYRFDKSDIEKWVKEQKVLKHEEIIVIPTYKKKIIKNNKVNLDQLSQNLKDFNKYGQLYRETVSSI